MKFKKRPKRSLKNSKRFMRSVSKILKTRPLRPFRDKLNKFLNLQKSSRAFEKIFLKK